MLAGDTVTEESRALASQLLENSLEGRTDVTVLSLGWCSVSSAA